jgi:predicted ATPase/DNA-binding winged helix-turn-helix (wHTH) protein
MDGYNVTSEHTARDDQAGPHGSSREVLEFGAFRLYPEQRRLERAGQIVKIGSRALDVLIALIEHAPEIFSKRDLVAQVWPVASVEAGNLRFQIASLRKVFEDADPGSTYIRNVSGQGYCFVQPIARLAISGSAAVGGGRQQLHSRLPQLTQKMVGREKAVREIVANVTARNFVSVVGPGGVGKTMVAVTVSHALNEPFGGAVRFVDLGPIRDQELLPAAVASTLGLHVNSPDPIQAILAFVRDKRMLLVLDGCEHLRAAVAGLAEHIFKGAPGIHVLATSREPLRIEPEQIHRLPTLEYPPDAPGLTAVEAEKYPAVQLFMNRTALKLVDADAPYVARICRKLDGLALALELAAGPVDAFGIRGIAELLEGKFGVPWQGRRTAVPRHQTLSAALDWSYDLLSEPERAVLRALSIFVGFFSLDAAQEIVGGNPEFTLAVINVLHEKSLIGSSRIDSVRRFRMLDTTRAYITKKVDECGETEAICRRHARYYISLLAAINPGVATLSSREGTALYGEHVDNVRSSLEWCFSDGGDIELGVGLAAVATAMFLQTSLLVECRTWTQRALEHIDRVSHTSHSYLALQVGLGNSLMFTRGNSAEVQSALNEALGLAVDLDDPFNELRTLATLNMFHHRLGDFPGALAVAQSAEVVARAAGHPEMVEVAESLLSVCFHLVGSQAVAERHFRAAFPSKPCNRAENRHRFGREFKIRALAAFARTLWLGGRAEKAVQKAMLAIEEAESFGHVSYLCMAHLYTVPLFIWMGDWARAEFGIRTIEKTANEHSLLPYLSDALGFAGQLALRMGHPKSAIDQLERALRGLHGARHPGILDTMFASDLAEAMLEDGRGRDALPLLDQAIAKVENLVEWYHLPEMLRIKGMVLAGASDAADGEAEGYYLRSIALARKIDAPAWELRTATSLATLWRDRGLDSKAFALLEPVYKGFAEGHCTPDLIAAVNLIRQMS